MKNVLMLLLVGFVSLTTIAQERHFGEITLTPYVPDELALESDAKKLLADKLARIAVANGVAGGFDRRFVITANLNLLDEVQTATIPQKTSIKVSLTFFVGDGMAGTLLGSHNVDLKGIGDSRDAAMLSVIRKIDVKDKHLVSLISQGKKQIVDYYDSLAPSLISDAKGYMAQQNFEDALAKLSVIPSVSDSYQAAQELIQACGKGIIQRDNTSYIAKARTAWSTNPTREGAYEARGYLENVVVTSAKVQNEVNKLNKEMSRQLIEIDKQERAMEEVRLLSEERLRTEQIRASERTATAFFGMLPKLVYNVLRWF